MIKYYLGGVSIMKEVKIPMWNPETDACDYCKECEYFLHEYWNCQGELEPCLEFLSKRDSKYRKVEIVVSKEN